jgi:DNA-binding response OmpR family regulator
MSKIALIEDDATMLNLLKILLQMEGFEVIFPTPFNEQAIVELIQLEKPDIVLMDVHLRQADGLTILSQLNQDQSISLPKNYKILMTSGEDLRDECLKAGADGFLMKPYMPDDLISWLRAA